MAVIKEELEVNNKVINLLADNLSIDTDKILDFDLFLYPVEKGAIIGVNEEFISSPKLDDLAMVHAGLKAIINTKAKKVLIYCFVLIMKKLEVQARREQIPR